MESYSVVIVLLAIAVGLSPFADRWKIPYPILLLVAGIAVGFIPGFDHITINHEVVFLIFLPPMLYDAAFNISFKDFKENLPTISLLAVTLVFLTATAIAVVVYYLIPDMSWPLSFVLGAILSPPDAIAATSVTKGLGLSHRTSTILEGESLINDASALVAFRVAVAVVAGGSFVFWKAGVMFFVMLIGGFIVGWLLSHIFILVAQKRLDKNVIVSLNLMLPFVSYLIAEEFHVSGVIAAVVAGLLVARHKNKLPGHTHAQSKSIWDTTIFILGGLVFILIGLEFPQVVKDISQDDFLPLIGCAFLIFVIALIIRMLIILLHKRNVEKRYDALVKRYENASPEKREKWEQMRRKFSNSPPFNPADFDKSKLLTMKEAVIIGWSGMRGIVSLAVALSLPIVTTEGIPFPQRDIIIFLTVVVVIIMLLVQGLGLPAMVKLLKIDNHDVSSNLIEK